MKIKNIGIYDEEQEYASQLMEYLSRNPSADFRVILFTSLEKLTDFLAGTCLDILLISENEIEQFTHNASVRHIVLLCEEENGKEEKDDYSRIFRYQQSSRIEDRIKATLFAGNCMHNHTNGEETVQYIAVLSPEGGSGKTTFCMALGQVLAKENHVLYLSFEQFGDSISDRKNGSMSEIIYSIKQRRDDLMVKLQEQSIRIGDMDVIQAVSCYEDIIQIDCDDIDFLLQEIRKCGLYQKVVIDIGSLSVAILHLLSECQSIYGTSLPWNSAHLKHPAFGQNLEALGYGDVLERIQWIDLPLDQKIISHQLLFEHIMEGELGEYIHERIFRTKDYG